MTKPLTMMMAEEASLAEARRADIVETLAPPHRHRFYWVERGPALSGIVRCRDCTYRLELTVPRSVAEVRDAQRWRSAL